MQKLINEITTLSEEWYNLINNDHHKDRDCHWYITTKWSYGLPPKYIVEHNGYILDEFYITCDTYEQALYEVKTLIKRSIERVKDDNH